MDFFVYRAAKEVAALGSSLGGFDAVVFSAGIGERSEDIRERVCRKVRWLGIELHDDSNGAGGPRITTATSRSSAWVIPTDDELMVARPILTALGRR